MSLEARLPFYFRPIKNEDPKAFGSSRKDAHRGLIVAESTGEVNYFA